MLALVAALLTHSVGLTAIKGVDEVGDVIDIIADSRHLVTHATSHQGDACEANCFKHTCSCDTNTLLVFLSVSEEVLGTLLVERRVDRHVAGVAA